MSTLSVGSDPRAVATYDFSEAAQYFHLPKSTVRAWVCGQDGFEPLIVPAGVRSPMLSFINLVEIHMLAAIRRVHRVKMEKVRQALGYLGGSHPLANHRLKTDGVDLFVDMVGDLVNLSKPNQRMMVDVMTAHLKRIRWDDDKAAALFPFPTANSLDGRKSVMIDPKISFGRLVIAGTGIAAEIVVERFRAGESIDELAKDYRRDRLELEDLLRFEPALAA